MSRGRPLFESRRAGRGGVAPLDDETLRLRLSGQVSLHDLRDVCGGALSWSALRSASLRTVLAPKRVARRVNASIRAAKGRVADVFARACDDGICKARALAEALAPLAGPFVQADALWRPRRDLRGETAPESGCPDCADTCWYGCDCPCHDQLMSEEEDWEVVSREPPALGASIHVRVAGATQCFPRKSPASTRTPSTCSTTTPKRRRGARAAGEGPRV